MMSVIIDAGRGIDDITIAIAGHRIENIEERGDCEP